ncbi:GTP-binding protein [Thermus sp. LT1-2-5]|uniref:dynamin family protein n=1 Tax=Thermus sp. LT1-2-5 TaxID=3026935 RepID=UPI0030E7FECE
MRLEEAKAAKVRVRDLLLRGLEALSRTPVDPAPLRQALLDLEGPFLLVVVGEFNSGKSSLVNALLGEDLLPEGPTPTTDRIQLLAYGEGEGEEAEGFLRLPRPHPLLKDLALVDTPGTNALLAHHEVLTRRFLPRADLILFVTSADRPLTRSEGELLALIRDWGKKVVLVVNKADLLSGADREAVARYVGQGAREVLGEEVPLFLVSARLGKEGRDEGLERLRAHVERTLAGEALPLKLSAALGVFRRLLREGEEALDREREEVERALATCGALEALLARHADRVRRDFSGQVALVERVFREVEERGYRFLEETVRLGRLPDLLNAKAFRESFLREVVQDAGARLERAVGEALRWLARREEELLLDALTLLKEARPVPKGEEPLYASLEEALARFRPEAEAERLSGLAQEAVVRALAGGVGGLGLGAALALALKGLVADLTGLLAGFFVAFLALSVLPRRKERAKRLLSQGLAEAYAAVRKGLEEALEEGLSRQRERFEGLYRDRCEALRARLGDLEARRGALRALAEEARVA